MFDTISDVTKQNVFLPSGSVTENVIAQTEVTNHRKNAIQDFARQTRSLPVK